MDGWMDGWMAKYTNVSCLNQMSSNLEVLVSNYLLDNLYQIFGLLIHIIWIILSTVDRMD